MELPVSYIRKRYAGRLQRLQLYFPDKDLVEAWQKGNPQCMDNFVNWFLAELSKKHRYVEQWMVFRLDDTKPYGPDNCELIPRSEYNKRVKRYPVTNVLIAAVKECRRDNPTWNATRICREFAPYSPTLIRDILANRRTKK